jgi:ribosome-binding protein aMBF1 (putative translation factor)
MLAVAELAPAPSDVPLTLGLPPGSLPIEAVRSVVRCYRSGVGSAESVIRMVDRHGEALEGELARKITVNLAELRRVAKRMAALHGWTTDLLAQREWLNRFPSPVQPEAVSLKVQVNGRGLEVAGLLAALTVLELEDHALELELRARGAPRRALDSRRGAAASMAALAEAGHSTTDVALAVGVNPSRVWAMLNGHQVPTQALFDGLERLLGAQRANLVRCGIPEQPRARRPKSPAIQALESAGMRCDDVAALIPVQRATVRGWLNGRVRPSPKLAGALEQLLGAETAARVMRLIPVRPSLE